MPPDLGERQVAAVAPNVLDRTFEAPDMHYPRRSVSHRTQVRWIPIKQTPTNIKQTSNKQKKP
jgi:hypothetical protein